MAEAAAAEIQTNTRITEQHRKGVCIFHMPLPQQTRQHTLEI